MVIPVGDGLAAGSQAVVYAASGNRDVSSGLTYAAAVRQTVTLLFGRPLPAGSYEITVSPNVKAANFNSDEAHLLSQVAGMTGHSVVQDATFAGASK